MFLLLDSWRARRVPVPAQPQSKICEPGGLSAKGKLILHKEYGHCLPPAPGSPPGSELAHSQPAAAGAREPAPCARLGLTGDGSWQGTALLHSGSFALCAYYNGTEKSSLRGPSSSAAGGLGSGLTNLHSWPLHTGSSHQPCTELYRMPISP